MLESRLIEESEERPDPEEEDERRRYYRLTTFGMPSASRSVISLIGTFQSQELFAARRSTPTPS